MRLTAFLAVAGGFLDAFTFLGHGGVFANAQTGNTVLLAVFASGGAWTDAVRHVLPIVAFVVGVGIAETVFHPRVAPRLRRPPRAALILEIAVLAVVGALPGSFSNTVVVVVVAFVAAFQSATFGRLGNWSVSTTMTTGNLRTATSAAYRALIHHERDASPQAFAFGVVCVAFLLGAALGALLTRRLHEHASWGACVLLSAGLLLLVLDERRQVSGRSGNPTPWWFRAAPASVGRTVRPDRSSSLVPSAVSICLICCESVGWDTCSASAAATRSFGTQCVMTLPVTSRLPLLRRPRARLAAAPALYPTVVQSGVRVQSAGWRWRERAADPPGRLDFAGRVERRLDRARRLRARPHSLTDLAGLRVSAEDFLAAALGTAAQPIWVVDPDDVIRFANPAAITALGYDSADELLGRHRHETIHDRHPDGTPYRAAECPLQLARTTGQTVARDLDWFFRRDGSTFPVSYVSVPIEMPEGRGAVVAFTDIENRVRAEQMRRERDAVLGAREDSLRRIAALVAGGAASADVFAAIAREVGGVVGLPLVLVWRYAPDRTTATVIGAWSEGPHPFQPGTRWPLDGPAILTQVLKTGRPARIDDFSELPGTIADAARKTGVRAGAGAPSTHGMASSSGVQVPRGGDDTNHKPRATASSRGGVGRKPETKSRP